LGNDWDLADIDYRNSQNQHEPNQESNIAYVVVDDYIEI
jgi:hypothetical protein